MFGSSNVPARVGLTGLPRSLDVGYRRENVQPIRGHAPLHAAVGAAFAHARLPHHLALFRGIERPDDSRLLSGQQEFAAIRRMSQNRRRAEIEIRAAVRGVTGATPVIDILRSQLAGPDDASRRQIERDHRVAGVRRGRANNCLRCPRREGCALRPPWARTRRPLRKAQNFSSRVNSCLSPRERRSSRSSTAACRRECAALPRCRGRCSRRNPHRRSAFPPTMPPGHRRFRHRRQVRP